MKSFLSRDTDCFRSPYERAAIERPRRCVIVGTVNPDEFLRDEENRRLLVIRVSQRIDIEQVERDREMIWAAAVALYKSGEQNWLTPDEADQQRESNKQFAVRDAWDDAIEEWLSEPSHIYQKTEDGKTMAYVRVPEIYEDCLKITEIKDHNGFTKSSVQGVLRRLGWEVY